MMDLNYTAPLGVVGAAQFLSKQYNGHKLYRTPVWLVRHNLVVNSMIDINYTAPLQVVGAA